MRLGMLVPGLLVPGLLVPSLAVALVPVFADAHTCKCRNRGTMFELGETSCLQVDGGSYLARCEMKLNVSSWTKVQDGCPVTENARAPIAVLN
jgi:hypothetical protein